MRIDGHFIESQSNSSSNNLNSSIGSGWGNKVSGEMVSRAGSIDNEVKINHRYG